MKNSILIVIDYQNDFVAPNGKVAKKFDNKLLKKSQKISTKIQFLIDKWHADKNIVLFLSSDLSSKYYKGNFQTHKNQSAYGNTAIKGTWGHKLYKLKYNNDDKSIVKHFFDGFYKTNLDKYLKNKKIKNIFLCGINTDVCLFHTAIGAMYRGYNVFAIEDATASIHNRNKKIFLDYLINYVGVRTVKSNKII